MIESKKNYSNSRANVICLIVAFVVCISLVPGIYALDHNYSNTILLEGTHNDSKLSLEISKELKTVNGVISFQNDSIVLEIENQKVIIRNDKMVISDRTNNIKLLIRELPDTKYLVLVKSDNTLKMRALITDMNFNIKQNNELQENSPSIPPQRNLLAEYIQANTEIDQTLSDVQTIQDRIEEELKTDLENLDKSLDYSSFSDLSAAEILENLRLYNLQDNLVENIYYSQTDDDDTTTDTATTDVTDTTTTTTNFELFVSVPWHVQWRDSLDYSVLLTDDSAHLYNTDYSAFVGNRIENKIISINIFDPDGNTMYTTEATTDNQGEITGSYIIPDNITTRGEYQLIASLPSHDGNSKQEIFFVDSIDNDSTNIMPIADIGANPLFPVLNGTSIIINGTQSYDSDGSFDELTFQYIIIGDSIQGSFDDPTKSNPVFTVNENLADSTITIQLIVKDRKSLASNPDTIEIKTGTKQYSPLSFTVTQSISTPDTSLDISWSIPDIIGINSPLTGYEIKRKLTSTESDFISIFNVTSIDTFYQDDTLNSNTSYDYQLFGVNYFGNGVYSDIVTEITAASP
jgi:hypothetical protein